MRGILRQSPKTRKNHWIFAGFAVCGRMTERDGGSKLVPSTLLLPE
jgi:hypothetical protein